MNDFIKKRAVFTHSGLNTLEYTYPTNKGVLNFLGYFLIESYQESHFLNLTYRLTQIFDPVEFINNGNTKDSKVFILQNKEKLYEPIVLNNEFIK